ncbi:MAG TPA: hypothetical protein VGE26_05445 [Sphingobacteriaceae bacterium]
MEPIKVMATIDDAIYEVEVQQPDPKKYNFEVLQDGKPIGTLHKENEQWYANEESCLMQDDIKEIGKAVDARLKDNE